MVFLDLFGVYDDNVDDDDLNDVIENKLLIIIIFIMIMIINDLIDVVKENLLLVRHLVRGFEPRRQLGGCSLRYLSTILSPR